MLKTEKIISDMCLFMLILLWVYAAVSKLMRFEIFQLQITRQHFSRWLTISLPYILPFVELVCALLLTIPRTRRYGFIMSAGLMLSFTVYIGLVLLRAFGEVPCSCGGVISSLGWKSHFVFNLFFLLLSFSGIYITDRERRMVGK